MELATVTGSVNNVTSDQLAQYRSLRHESDYVLVDVRQPEEYSQ